MRRLRSRNAHGHSPEPVYKKSAVRQSRHISFVRACAIVLCEAARSTCAWPSTCTWTCHDSNFMWKVKGKMPNAQDISWIEQRASTLTVGTPQCGHTVLGMKIHMLVLRLQRHLFIYVHMLLAYCSYCSYVLLLLAPPTPALLFSSPSLTGFLLQRHQPRLGQHLSASTLSPSMQHSAVKLKAHT